MNYKDNPSLVGNVGRFVQRFDYIIIIRVAFAARLQLTVISLPLDFMTQVSLLSLTLTNDKKLNTDLPSIFMITLLILKQINIEFSRSL